MIKPEKSSQTRFSWTSPDNMEDISFSIPSTIDAEWFDHMLCGQLDDMFFRIQRDTINDQRKKIKVALGL